MSFLNQYVFGVGVPILLMVGGIFFLCYLRGYPLRAPWRMLCAMRGGSAEGVSPVRAMLLALAGTLGVGNIVGVASAIAMGGAGAIFWMWISAFFAMLMKYAEIVLAMRHRRFDEVGSPHGSAMQYIMDYMERIGAPRTGRLLSVCFALLFLLNAVSMGSAVQSNAVAGVAQGVMGIPGWFCGVLLAILAMAVILRGTEKIAYFTEKLVPLMSLGFAVLSVVAILSRGERVGDAFGAIFAEALQTDAAAGGIAGFLLSRALRYGTMRGLLSNEGGCGTSPTAHAASTGTDPVKQGILGVFEVFVDTIALCTVTALVILVSGAELEVGENAVMLTVRAYEAILGRGASYFLTVAIFCFGFATTVCWAHYGMEAMAWIRKGSGARGVFQIGYAIAIAMGGMVQKASVWEMADLAIGGMTMLNVFYLLLMRGEIREETLRYFAKKRNNFFRKSVDKWK